MKMKHDAGLEVESELGAHVARCRLSPGGQHDRMQSRRYVDSCKGHVRSGVRARVVEDRDEGVKDSRSKSVRCE